MPATASVSFDRFRSLTIRGPFFWPWDACLWLGTWTLGADSFPHLSSMDRQIGSGVEAQPNATAANVDYRDFEQLLRAVASADHD
jgi:hypothetical protein